MHKKKYSGILIPTHCVIDKDFNLNPRENAAIKHVLGMFEAQVIYIVFPTQETLEHKPDSPPPMFSDPFPAVPQEFKELRQWVCWRYVVKKKGEKPTKVPFQVNGDYAKPNVPRTWTDYETVCNHKAKFDGIGFVFSEADPYAGIDLDNCIDKEGNIKAWAMPIINALKPVAYMEISPSGIGLKAWTQAKYTAGFHKVYIRPPEDDAIEGYDSRRFFTVTGKGKGETGNGQAVVDRLVNYMERVKARNTPKHTSNQKSIPQATGKTAAEVKELIQHSQQVYKFDALMNGNIKAYGSHSEADQALCCMLAFWTQDASVIDTIFRESGLYRDKWDVKHRSDGATYGEMTIERALSFNTTTYTPKKRHRKTAAQRGRLSWL